MRADDVDLASFSLEELGNIRITSVSRMPQALSTAPASVFVITREDIHRYGVTSLPEALRLAPNLLVAQVGATEYAISARGFNNSIGNKLLVLIDGRTVYTPLFSGVFWDAQDVMLDDIERIEVLSGPGATIWGLNAVNGVINVITRSAEQTQDAVLNVGAGNVERTASFRYGGTAGPNGHYRVYGKYLAVENTKNAAGADLPDAWADAQIGFRADWGDSDRTFTLQGDMYSGESDARPLNNLDIYGLNLIARWERTFADGSNLRVYGYFDHSERSDLPVFEEQLDIFDVEIQHSLALDAHELAWGGGYRHAQDDVRNGPVVAFLPASRSLGWANAFVQDTVALAPNVALTVGAKLETNDYTDTEFLPTLRVGWTTPDSGFVWAALSRAVRSPARLDRELFAPGGAPFQIAGGPDFESEVSDVFEIGYRAEPTDTLSYSVTAFHHEHDKLRSLEPTPAGPLVLSNQIDGSTSGVEAWASWQSHERWRLSAGVLTVNQDLQRKPGSLDPTGPRSLGNDPDFQLLLRSTINLAQGRQLDILARHVGELPDPAVPSYTAVDARFAFSLGEATVLSITLRNMLDSHHPEFGTAGTRSEYERNAFVALTWRLP